ncbi:GCD complex subunit gcd7, partial [Quaeritorhiza haematococci]
MQSAHTAVENLIARLKRRQSVGSYNVSTDTLVVLRNVISANRWSSGSQLIQIVQDVGRRLIAAQTTELAVGNMVRRILHIIREEYQEICTTEDEQNKPLPCNV